MKSLPALSLVIGLAWLLPSACPSRLAAQTPLSELVDSSRLEKQPELKKLAKLKLRKKGVTGEVVLRFIVNKEGKVENLVIVSFNDPDFVEPAYQAYEAAEYGPGLFKGEPVATRIQVTATFPAR